MPHFPESLTAPRERLLQLLVETAFHVADTPQYRLSSGRRSPYYIDCKMVLSLPEARRLIGDLMVAQFAEILHAADAVGGLALGAYPLAVAVSDAMYRHTEKSLRAFVVRKEPKVHGLTKYLEGIESSDSYIRRVLIVDDVITTGESTIKAITKCQEAGFEVAHAIALVDREEDAGKAHIKQTGVSFDSLFVMSELLTLCGTPYGMNL